ncbi:hypothetical protein HCJ68_11475 [Listeria welshimeri]|nr:hypothetical protein [Listeria welshimeri]
MWREIKNVEQLESFLEEIKNFHDSWIYKVELISGTSLNERQGMEISISEGQIIYQSQLISANFELRLKGIDCFHINWNEAQSKEMSAGLIKYEENMFYWYSDDNFEDLNDISWFCCKKLLWRYSS